MYRIFFNCNALFTGLLLLLSLLVRMDNIIAVVILLVLMKTLAGQKTGFLWPSFFGFMLLALTQIALMNYFLQHDFWWFTGATYLQSPAAYSQQVLTYLFSLSAGFLPAILFLGSVVFFGTKQRLAPLSGGLLIAIGIIIIARFLFFPSVEERFMTAYYLCLMLIIIQTMVSAGFAPGWLRSSSCAENE